MSSSSPPATSQSSRNHFRGRLHVIQHHHHHTPLKTANMMGAAGKQHYLQANPSHGARQLQTLHVIPPPPPPPGDTPLCLRQPPPLSLSLFRSLSISTNPTSPPVRTPTLPSSVSFSVTRPACKIAPRRSCHGVEE